MAQLRCRHCPLQCHLELYRVLECQLRLERNEKSRPDAENRGPYCYYIRFNHLHAGQRTRTRKLL